MRHIPKVMVLDVIETLFGLDPLDAKLRTLGLAEGAI